jgi:hypothetical protein
MYTIPAVIYPILIFTPTTFKTSYLVAPILGLMEVCFTCGVAMEAKTVTRISKVIAPILIIYRIARGQAFSNRDLTKTCRDVLTGWEYYQESDGAYETVDASEYQVEPFSMP